MAKKSPNRRHKKLLVKKTHRKVNVGANIDSKPQEVIIRIIGTEELQPEKLNAGQTIVYVKPVFSHTATANGETVTPPVSGIMHSIEYPEKKPDQPAVY